MGLDAMLIRLSIVYKVFVSDLSTSCIAVGFSQRMLIDHT